MSTLIIMKGLPCSGKTKWAKEWASAKHNRVRVSWTDILQTMGEGHRREKVVIAYDAALRIAKNCLRQGKDVVLDEMNLYAPSFSLFIAAAQMAKAKIEWKPMKVGPEECKKKSAQSEHPICGEVIDRLWEKYRLWIES